MSAYYICDNEDCETESVEFKANNYGKETLPKEWFQVKCGSFIYQYCPQCKGFYMNDFKQIVKDFIDKTGNEGRRKLADEMECALTTIDRWATGIAEPRPNMKAEVIKWIQEQ